MAQVRIDGTVHRLPSSAVTASRHARKVLADVVERIGPLRNRAIFIGARAPHAQTAAERQMLLAEFVISDGQVVQIGEVLRIGL